MIWAPRRPKTPANTLERGAQIPEHTWRNSSLTIRKQRSGQVPVKVPVTWAVAMVAASIAARIASAVPPDARGSAVSR